jgi:hypothetical protein
MRIRTAVLAIGIAVGAATAQAQSGAWWIGGGLLMPSGDAADGLKSGFGGTAGILWSLPNNWSLQAEGIVSSNAAKTGSADMTMMGLLGNLAYDWNPDAKVHPYAWGGIGIVSAKASGGDSNSDMAWQVGAGLSWKTSGTMTVWSDVKMLSVMSDPSTNFMGLTVGIGMPWGKKP